MAGDIQITGKTIGKQYTVVQSLVRANAEQLLLLKEAAEILVYETNPARANYYIEEWEALVGIPDDVLNIEENLTDRVANVLFKITNNNEPTQKNILRFAEIFGVNVEFVSWASQNCLAYTLGVSGLYDSTTMPYRIFLNVSSKRGGGGNSPNSLPQPFPVLLTKSFSTNFEKIIKLIIPANYDITLKYI